MSSNREYLPHGDLAKVLEKFDAPGDVQSAITRRAGAVAGKGVPVKAIERRIVDSMRGTVPHWPTAIEEVGRVVNRFYRDAKRPK